ncbi:MAG TPA: PIG-L family deacetylase [Flavobacterium sp.]|jgi:LmbE family N-acetylglucosaminyl deacetylase
MPKFAFTLIAFLFLSQSSAQQPEKPGSSEIYQKIRKLNFLGSVLYIAAHPDDENTRLISYFANNVNARTGYLSLTRGDGGQNLIGPELREMLGVIRTQELIEARKIDGGEQFFTRANDFGYSKRPEETMSLWEKDKVLSDVVWAIRKFRPDVIINRFDNRTPGTTHGHHTASAMLSLEAFDLAASNSYPSQLTYVKPWQPKRLLFNTNYWFFGGKEKFEKADKSKFENLSTGTFYPTLGKSNQEIAALSRSRHRSQGFGSTGTRGEETEFLELMRGDKPAPNDLFAGIDTSWNRVAGGTAIGTLLRKVEQQFDFKNPSLSIPDLLTAYQMIQMLKDQHWKEIKSDEIKNVIAACSGLYLEAVADEPDATPGAFININIEAINRSAVPVKLISVAILPQIKQTQHDLLLENNKSHFLKDSLQIPVNMSYTQPYWLKEKSSGNMYTVNDQLLIGKPDIQREVKTIFNVAIDGVIIPFERTVIYKYNDDVQGEVYEPFDIVPQVSTSIVEKVHIFPENKNRKVTVKVKSGKDAVQGSVKLMLPPNWVVTPPSASFNLALKNSEELITFEVKAPANAEEATGRAVAIVNGVEYDQEQIYIRYPHISKQQVLQASEVAFIKPQLKIGNEKIAYIVGAGDQVHESLAQMGYEVTILNPLEITPSKLAGFDVVITGIRAYNMVKELAVKQEMLLEFVRSGKTMIVQYNTLDDFVTKHFSPFPLKISRDRVTEENAEVRFLAPQHRILNYPNKITSEDFKGWKQEQGLYYPNEWDPAFTPILSANDTGENPKNGGLLVAKYGKGHYIYTGLSFFRELPEGVPGAFRLMANLISVGSK